MRLAFACIATLALVACASPKPQDYAAQKPVLDLKAYFSGKVDGWGAIQDRSGKVTKRMYVEMTGTWNGDVGTLDERFTYSDGTRDSRVWTIRKAGDRYVGTAPDVAGEASGQAAGNSLNWSYVLRAKRDNGQEVELAMDDWMWLVDERTMMNRTTFSKLGIRLGEVTFFFRKRDDR
jgi:hypothetical protein